MQKNCCENKEQIINIQESYRLINQENLNNNNKLKAVKTSNISMNSLNYKCSKKQSITTRPNSIITSKLRRNTMDYQSILSDFKFFNRLYAIQSLSGTGALKIGQRFLSEFYPFKKKIFLSSPTWGNHLAIAQSCHFDIGKYSYYD